MAKVPIEELAELLDGWARGIVTSAQVEAALGGGGSKANGNPSVRGNLLVLAGIRRLVRSGASLVPLE